MLHCRTKVMAESKSIGFLPFAAKMGTPNKWKWTKAIIWPLTAVIKWCCLPKHVSFVCKFLSPCLHHVAVYLELSDMGAVSMSSKFQLPHCHISSRRWKLGGCDLIPHKPERSDNSLERIHWHTERRRDNFGRCFFSPTDSSKNNVWRRD